MLSKIVGSNQHPLNWLGCARRRRRERLIEPGPQVTIRKQIHPEQRDEIRERPAEGRLQLQVLQDQQRDQRGPDLNVQGVRGRADEGLHSEVLLQRLEEQLNLPAILIDPRDGGRAQVQVIGEEVQVVALRADDFKAAQRVNLL